MAVTVPADTQRKGVEIIDPHVHIFEFNKGQYFWLEDLSEAEHHTLQSHQCITEFAQRETTTKPIAIKGFVHIEAGFNNLEPALELNAVEQKVSLSPSQTNEERQKCCFKTIGYADISAPNYMFETNVDEQLQHPSCVGFRHILDEQTLKTLTQLNTRDNLQYLANKGSILELQLPIDDTKAIAHLITLLEQSSTLVVIINHAGKPPFQHQDAGKYQRWRDNTQALSLLSNVHMKCSGWEMQAIDYSEEQISKVLKHLLQCFGENRLMIASNYPLTLYSKGYYEYWTFMLDVIETAICLVGIDSETQKGTIKKLCCDNALRIYRMH